MTKQETLNEIERLTEWCTDMTEMMLTDGTVPTHMMSTYHAMTIKGQERLRGLKDKAYDNGWIAE